MTTENRDWLTVGATVAVISTGRTTGITQISMDTVDSIGDQLITTMGHQFNLDTLEATAGRYDMYLWRLADPEAPETKLALAVQAREKMLSRVLMYQRNVERTPMDPAVIDTLMTALTEYKALVLAADALTEASKVSA